LEEHFFMRGFTRHLTISAVAILLVSGLIAGSSTFARAQQAASQSDDGGGSASASAQPAAKIPPANFAGCWDGTGTLGSLVDQAFGDGIGWIGIAQKGKHIKGGRRGSYYEFLWEAGSDYAYGPASGKATATGFTITGKAGGQCRIKIIGGFGTSNDIVGTYSFHHCAKNGLNVSSGTFDLPYDPSGCGFIAP
jgi:hypothetical protein